VSRGVFTVLHAAVKMERTPIITHAIFLEIMINSLLGVKI
jgi:hypothetical protein